MGLVFNLLGSWINEAMYSVGGKSLDLDLGNICVRKLKHIVFLVHCFICVGINTLPESCPFIKVKQYHAIPVKA